mmetsp:Transcript_86549/g.217961  ORF Transcript_86549/g.217961 Transcript_86549/m.217961 type:complete len:212 (-) Transcript_86549:278-913(-)
MMASLQLEDLHNICGASRDSQEGLVGVKGNTRNAFPVCRGAEPQPVEQLRAFALKHLYNGAILRRSGDASARIIQSHSSQCSLVSCELAKLALAHLHAQPAIGLSRAAHDPRGAATRQSTQAARVFRGFDPQDCSRPCGSCLVHVDISLASHDDNLAVPNQSLHLMSRSQLSNESALFLVPDHGLICTRTHVGIAGDRNQREDVGLVQHGH